MKMLTSVLLKSSLLAAIFSSSISFAEPAQGNADGPVQVPGNATAAAGSAAPVGAPAWVNFALIGGIIVFMWLFVFRPQAKRAKEQKEFLSSLVPGLEVVTSGGVIGTISEVNDNVVSLKISDSSTVKLLKSAIASKFTATQVSVAAK